MVTRYAARLRKRPFAITLYTAIVFTALFCLNAALPRAAQAALVVPGPLRAWAPVETPKIVMDRFLSIPYRADGMVDDEGRYSLFASPEKVFSQPGLNCSGLVLEGARLLLEKNISFRDAIRDRLGDSGSNAAKGQDWDFGWDLVMNISEAYERTLITPDSDLTDFGRFSGTSRPGWEAASPAIWAKLLPRIKAGKLYLLTFSRHKDRQAPAHLHYHVALVFRSPEKTSGKRKDEGNAWLYHTTHNKGMPERLNLDTPEGQNRFRQIFRDTKASIKRVSIMEIPMAR